MTSVRGSEVEVVADFAAFGHSRVHDDPRRRQLQPRGRRAGARGHGRAGPRSATSCPRRRDDSLATAAQVHGATCARRTTGGWEGWLRGDDADGHIAAERGTALAVTIADCVPVFIAHPSGVVALLHSGWRGTAARIVERGDRGARASRPSAPTSSRIHLGPSICGRCYEVSAEVTRAAHRASPLRGRRTSISAR